MDKGRKRRAEQEADVKQDSRLLRLPDVLLATVLSFSPLHFAFREGKQLCRAVNKVYKTCGKLALCPDLRLMCFSDPRLGLQYDGWSTQRPICVMEELANRGVKLHELEVVHIETKEYDHLAFVQSLLALEPEVLEIDASDVFDIFQDCPMLAFGPRLKVFKAHRVVNEACLQRLIGTAPNLTSFSEPANSWDAEITDVIRIFEHAHNLTSLEVSDPFSYSFVDSSILEDFARCFSSRLTSLCIDFDMSILCDAALRHLSKLTQLCNVELHITVGENGEGYEMHAAQYLKDLDMRPLCAWTKLESVTLDTWPLGNATSLAFLFTEQVCSRIKSLRFLDAKCMTNNQVTDILTHLPNLESLTIEEGYMITCSSFEGAHPRHLQTLELTFNENVTWENRPFWAPSKLCDLQRSLHLFATWPALKHLTLLLPNNLLIISPAAWNPNLTELELAPFGMGTSTLCDPLRMKEMSQLSTVELRATRFPLEKRGWCDIQSNFDVSSNTMGELLASWPRLIHATLDYPCLDFRVLNHLSRHRFLASVTFNASPAIDMEGIHAATLFWKAMKRRRQEVRVRGHYFVMVETWQKAME